MTEQVYIEHLNFVLSILPFYQYFFASFAFCLYILVIFFFPFSFLGHNFAYIEHLNFVLSILPFYQYFFASFAFCLYILVIFFFPFSFLGPNFPSLFFDSFYVFWFICPSVESLPHLSLPTACLFFTNKLYVTPHKYKSLKTWSHTSVLQFALLCSASDKMKADSQWTSSGRGLTSTDCSN